MTAVLAAGFILLAVAAIAGLVPARPGRARAAPYLAGAAGGGCLAVEGGFALSGCTVALNVRPPGRHGRARARWRWDSPGRLWLDGAGGDRIAVSLPAGAGGADALVAVIAVVTALAEAGDSKARGAPRVFTYDANVPVLR